MSKLVMLDNDDFFKDSTAVAAWTSKKNTDFINLPLLNHVATKDNQNKFNNILDYYGFSAGSLLDGKAHYAFGKVDINASFSSFIALEISDFLVKPKRFELNHYTILNRTQIYSTFGVLFNKFFSLKEPDIINKDVLVFEDMEIRPLLTQKFVNNLSSSVSVYKSGNIDFKVIDYFKSIGINYVGTTYSKLELHRLDGKTKNKSGIGLSKLLIPDREVNDSIKLNLSGMDREVLEVFYNSKPYLKDLVREGNVIRNEDDLKKYISSIECKFTSKDFEAGNNFLMSDKGKKFAFFYGMSSTALIDAFIKSHNSFRFYYEFL